MKECNFCGSYVRHTTSVERPPGSIVTANKADFCDFCYGTFASNAFWYPQQYENGTTMKVVCGTMNILLSKLSRGAK